jgi:DNA-directed RNA polymerase subunit beta'
MAVHVPLSVEAQMEARMLMLAPNNIFSPSSGKPITTPSQDITLGCYYLTQNPRRAVGAATESRLPLFANATEVEFAMADGKVKVHDRIRYKNPNLGMETVYGNSTDRVIETTAGRVIFNGIWPNAMGFFNKPAGKKQLTDIIWRCYQVSGQQGTVETLDLLKELGFTWATKAGVSIGINDMIIPKEKQTELDNAYKQIKTVEQQYRKGIITDGERYNKIIDIWTHAGDEISNVMFRTLEHNEGRKELNPVFLMVDSGARGNRQQVKQLAGMRGLMAKPSGEIIERPITSNFREGLSVLEYFISTHGARKGSCRYRAEDGRFRLPDSQARRRVAGRDHQRDGLRHGERHRGEIDLRRRRRGRRSLDPYRRPRELRNDRGSGHEEEDHQGEPAGRRTDRGGAREDRRGEPEDSFGADLRNRTRRLRALLRPQPGHGQFVKLGEAVGIIAAQSIGEPGTQLTMRTFHIGGTASQTFKQPIIKAKNDGTIQFNELRTVQALDGSWIVLNKNGSIGVHNSEGRELERYNVVIGSVISKADGGPVKKGETFVQWDPYNVPILTDKTGKIEFRDMIAGVTIKRDVDEATGLMGTVIIEHKEDLHPQIVVVGDKKESSRATRFQPALTSSWTKARRSRPVRCSLRRRVSCRRRRTSRAVCPRVAELFEARRPKGFG